jgi:Fe-S cluster biogenesis protein NfuA
MKARVQEVIDQIRPNLQADGGDIELVDVTPEGIVKVKLQGACSGCPGAAMTLKMGVEKMLKKHVPEVTGVERV